MATLDDYRGIQVLDPTPPPGGGGWAIDDNFRKLIGWSPKSNWAASSDPTVNDDEDSPDFYHVGSLWYNNAGGAKRLFICIDSTTGAAVWHPILPGGGNGKVVSDPAGNSRGTGAVDLQMTRSANTQVASATNATIGGGSGNTANGNYATVAGGTGNTASNTNATVAGGTGCTASGTHSFAAGETCTASGSGTFACCSNTSASASFASAFGRYASATHNGEMARASGQFASAGDAQTSYMVARNTTTNATQTELFLNAVNVRATVPNNCTWLFTVSVVARRTGGTVQSAAYQIIGAIRNNGGTTALLGTPTKTVIYEDVAGWDVTVDATNTSLAIKVTGEASKTIQWVADIKVVQVLT